VIMAMSIFLIVMINDLFCLCYTHIVLQAHYFCCPVSN